VASGYILVHEMSTRARVDPATEAWTLATRLMFSERPPRVPAVASELDLSPMALKLFYSLEPGSELSMSVLAETLFCDASNVTGIVDRLEARALIERRDDPRDRRVKLIALTDAGVAMREQIRARMHEPPAAIAALSRDDQRALRDILRRAVGS
jgi:DNA-binding MarR family transcriptional regulator